MVKELLTQKQISAHKYYIRNRQTCIDKATAYREANKEKFRQYQVEYFKNYKCSAAYKQKLDRIRIKRQQEKQLYKNDIIEKVTNITPLPIEEYETRVEEIRPSFSILTPPANTTFCVSFS